MRVNESSMHECSECTFVANSSCVYINPKILKQASRDNQIFLDYFTQPGWKGHLPFYAVKCPACENVFADYPHGYYKLYFRCDYCSEHTVVIYNREIYEKMNMPFPEELRKKFSNGRVLSWTKILGLVLLGCGSLLLWITVFMAIAEIISLLRGL